MANQFVFLERNLLWVTVVSLTLVGILAGISWGFLQQSIDNQLNDAEVANTASQQTTLSQRISNFTILLTSSTIATERQRYATELSAALDSWQQSHEDLRFSQNSDTINEFYSQIQPTYEAMLNAGRCLVALSGDATPSATCLSSEPAVYADIILTNESAFLGGMNRIVLQYNQESENRTENLAPLSTVVFGTTIAVLLAVLLYIMRPASLQMKQNSQDLASAQQALIKRDEQLLATQQSAQFLSRNLQAVVDLSSSITSVLNPTQLLQDVADLLQERFGLYHAHIYLHDQATGQLNLVVGAGYIGELMAAEGRSIALNNPNSIVARAGRSFRSVVANDVTQASDFLAHPLLPNTKAEFAVALMARGQLLGVLDMQSDQRGYFLPDIVNILEVVAGQIAVALNTATLFASLQQLNAHERALGNINRSIQQASTVDDILQVTVRELGKALRVPYTAIELQLDTASADE